ncbi:chaperone protein DnaJ-like [Planococcus citri]|uniref:chaperone protein DnaJ-like n=1 Tax=Planococcus citri TaxID=170843 RepID=UPI0031F9F31D
MNLVKLYAVNFNKNALKTALSGRTIYTSVRLLDKTFYEILRVAPDASQTEIKEAYYKLSKVYHPDIAQDENSLKMFRSITEAYDVLGNVRTRLQYDNESGIQSVAEEVTFHPSGHKDQNEWRKLAPDFDKILARKPVQEQWEDLQYKERRIEVQAKKHNFYIEDDYFVWKPWEKRIMRFGMAMFAFHMFMNWLDLNYYEKIFDRRT